MPPVPEHLLYEVFIRLPWRSLLRFRCVSKYFLEMIDSPSFIQKKKQDDQSHDSVTDFTVIITKSDGIMSSIDFNFPHNINNIVEEKNLNPPLNFKPTFTGCCNGILCLLNEKLQSFLLWNPFNNTFQTVFYPYEPYERIGNVVSMGFGYDHLTDDYKIVMLLNLGRTDDVINLCVYTYSMKRDSWGQEMRCEFPAGMHDHMYGVFVGNAIHWLWYDFDDKVCSFIAVFDLGTGLLRKVSLPLWLPPVRKPEMELTLVDLRGRLCLYVVLSSDYMVWDCSMVWEMEEYGVWNPLLKTAGDIWAIGYFPNWNNQFLCFGPGYKWSRSLSFCWFKQPQDKSSTSQIHVQLLLEKKGSLSSYLRRRAKGLKATVIRFKNQLTLQNSNLNHS